MLSLTLALGIVGGELLIAAVRVTRRWVLTKDVHLRKDR
jgi:hypothetical protein